jgi:hypothetical protein
VRVFNKVVDQLRVQLAFSFRDSIELTGIVCLGESQASPVQGAAVFGSQLIGPEEGGCGLLVRSKLGEANPEIEPAGGSLRGPSNDLTITGSASSNLPLSASRA